MKKNMFNLMMLYVQVSHNFQNNKNTGINNYFNYKNTIRIISINISKSQTLPKKN